MTITFVGHGYVGLVTACVFADFGNQVYVIGHTPEKLERLKKGDPLIYEPGLKEMLSANLKAKRLHFTADYTPAIEKSEIVFIAVGTPSGADGEANLEAVYHVAEKIGQHLKKGYTVVSCKSTVPVGTNKKVLEILKKNKSSNAEVDVASCPEFLREGTALYDTLNPDRVVIGADSKKAVELLLDLHKPLPGKRVQSDIASAELIKYVSNALLATKISYANLVSFYCEATGADVEEVLNAVGLDGRIGRVFLSPGAGYGGSCLPKDVRALIHTGANLGINTALLAAVEQVNEVATTKIIEKVQKHTKGKTIAVWGVSFKPDTDDIRYAPAIEVIKSLLEEGYKIRAYDPAALEHAKRLFGSKITYAKTPEEATEGADCVVVVTEWNQFKQIDLSTIKKKMKTPLLIDGRNIYEPAVMKKLGFSYVGVGRAL